MGNERKFWSLLRAQFSFLVSPQLLKDFLPSHYYIIIRKSRLWFCNLQRANISPLSSYTHQPCPYRHKGFILPFTNYFTSWGTVIAAKPLRSLRPLPHPSKDWNKTGDRGSKLFWNKCWGGDKWNNQDTHYRSKQNPAWQKLASADVGWAIPCTMLR